MTQRVDGVWARPDWYTPTVDRWTHKETARGCDPSCAACEREAEADERGDTDAANRIDLR